MKCDIAHLPYVDFCLDAVVYVHTVNHQKLKGIPKTAIENHRV
jgi:hypothetical protein